MISKILVEEVVAGGVGAAGAADFGAEIEAEIEAVFVVVAEGKVEAEEVAVVVSLEQAMSAICRDFQTSMRGRMQLFAVA